MSKLYAFVKRDILEQASYKFAFISSFFSIIFSTSTFFFLSRLISGPQIESLRIYGGSYFAFVIIGIAFSGTLQVFQGNLPGVIREAQVTGTLEAMLVTKTGIPTILLGSSLYNFMFSLANSIIHIILAVLVFGMQLFTSQSATASGEMDHLRNAIVKVIECKPSSISGLGFGRAIGSPFRGT